MGAGSALVGALVPKGGVFPLSRKPSGLSVRRCQHETGCVRERAWGSAAQQRRRHGWRGAGVHGWHTLGRCGLLSKEGDARPPPFVKAHVVFKPLQQDLNPKNTKMHVVLKNDVHLGGKQRSLLA